MKKVELALPVADWSTLKSKYAPDIKQVLTDEFTRGTINIDTQTKGAITKRKGSVTYNPTALAAAFKDQYEAIFSDGVRHTLAVQSGEVKYTSGDRIFNTVQNGTGFAAESNFEFELTQDRVYGGNGANDPIVYDRTTNYGGVVYTAPRIRTMGAIAPLTAPSVAVVAGGSVPVGSHTYKITYLYYDFEESNGGPASSVATTSGGNQTVNLTSIPIGGYGVTARKIYRDNNDGVFVLVGTVNNNTDTTFSDTVAAGTTPIPTDVGLPPTFGQIVLFLDSLFVADVPGQPSIVYFSQTGFPDIFPEANFIICNQKDPITALIVYQDRIIVFNRRSMGQILGRTPDQFRYSHIPGSVGCVDNRTIQTRTIDGVPVLVWLSDKGFYMYNGNSITYISEDIEDQVNVNIQQANYQKGSHADDSQADFQAGTFSQGIDLNFIPGAIVTKGYLDGTAAQGTNPRRTWDDFTDWELGSVKANIATRDTNNALEAVTRFAPTAASGSNEGTLVGGTNIALPVSQALNGETSSTITTPIDVLRPGSAGSGKYYSVAVPIIPFRSGVLTAAKVSVGRFGGAASDQWNVKIQTDFAGKPSGTNLGSATINSDGSSPLKTSTALNVSLTGGTKYWMVFEIGSSNVSLGRILQGSQISGGATLVKDQNGLNQPTGDYYAAPFTAAAGYNFSYTKISRSGTWVSPIYDSKSVNLTGTGTLSFSTFIIPNSSITLVGGTWQYSDDGVNFTTLVTQPPVSFQPLTFGLGNKRYWRFRVLLTTTDDVLTPTISAPIFTVSSAEWESEAIDTTANSTVYNSLDMVANVPSGTSATITIATSDDNITYTGFVPFGSVVVKRYAKIRVALNKNGDHSLTPSITSVTFKWTVVANLESAPIDTTASPPAGWSIFQASDVSNGGTIQYYMRSASSLLALASATYFLVTPEQLPPPSVVPLQYTQWKVIITSTDLHAPQINSVTVRWLLNTTQSLRAASIFVDRRYFVAVATIGSTTNNIVFELDVNNKWRVHDGLEASTMGFFFNEPYYGSSNVGKMFKFLEGFLDDETENIVIDIRTKAFDFSDRYADLTSKFKTLQEVVLNGVGTGADYTVQYSIDNGVTFTTIPHESGASSYLSTNDGMRFSQRFRVNFAYGNVVSGRTIMIRVTTNDEFDIQIHSLKLRAWIRNQE